MTNFDDSLARSFSQLDTNGNGVLEQEDFQALARRALQELGEAPNSPKRQALIQSYDSLWSNIAMGDTDDDGSVDREEYKAFMTNVASRHTITGIMTRISMSITDLDGDGKISLEEYLRSPNFTGDPLPVRHELFRKMDTDGDGYVSSQEMAQAMEASFSGR